jgi:hypothetical protein
MRRSIVLSCAFALASTALDASSAHACVRGQVEPFQIDRSLAAVDTAAPEQFRQVSAYTYRVEADRCNGNECTSSSCGDEGYLLLRFAPPPEAVGGGLGYRVVWLRGAAPPSLLRQLERVLPLDPQAHAISVDLSFKEMPLLEGELALVAIDRAGNESAPSEPVQVKWSGCTEFFFEPFCAEGNVVVPPEAEAEPRCALVDGPRAGRGLPLVAAGALGLGAAIRRRSQRRKRP